MKCKFCGAELLVGKDKCDFCGKYQHDAEVENKERMQETYDQMTQNQQPNQQQKKINIFSIIFKAAIFIVVILAILYFALEYINSNRSFYGTWRCNNGQLTVTIDKTIFKTNYGSDGYREADYLLERETKDGDIYTYYLNVSSAKRLINGQEFTDSNETEYEIVMKTDNSKEFILKNKITSVDYTCYKEE